jgi:hypothetical protein
MKGKIGDLVSYAPASANMNEVSTDISKYKGKSGKKTSEWDVWVKTTDWYRFQQRNK